MTSRRTRSRAVATVVACGAVVLASACTTSAPGTGTKGYIAGNGAVTLIDEGDRQPVPQLDGESLDGGAISLGDSPGQITVVNIWAQWCAPCRAEADDLVEAAQQLPDVRFFGIDIRDNRAAAQAFVRVNDIPYDSLFDPDGDSLLAFYDIVTIQSPPTTLVIDRNGEVAAVVSGELTASTLVGLVHDVTRGD